MKYNDPFYFAIPRDAALADRERALVHIVETFGLRGAVEFVRAERRFRLYRLVGVSK